MVGNIMMMMKMKNGKELQDFLEDWDEDLYSKFFK